MGARSTGRSVAGMSDDVIALASDHAGLALKAVLIEELQRLGFAALDLGNSSTASVDYPHYGYCLTAALSDGRASRGVALCGYGIGNSMRTEALRVGKQRVRTGRSRWSTKH